MSFENDRAFITRTFIPLLAYVRGIQSVWLYEEADAGMGTLVVFTHTGNSRLHAVVRAIFDDVVKGDDLTRRLTLACRSVRSRWQAQGGQRAALQLLVANEKEEG